MTISAMSFNLVNLHVLNHTRTYAQSQAIPYSRFDTFGMAEKQIFILQFTNWNN